jgi:hypothetical protein
MKTSNKVQNAKNRSHRGELPGDKQVKRNKRSTGVARIPQGETLPEAIKRDRLMSHATPRPVSSRGKQLQKQQVDRAYRSLNLTSGTYDAWISATFMQHWLAATPDKDRHQTKTGLAIKAVKASLPSDQAESTIVRVLLSNAAKAVKDAFVPIG